MRTVLICIAITAIFFGGWPLVARAAGKTGVTGAFVMAAMALVPIGLMLVRQGVSLPTDFSLSRLAMAGMMMGCGLVAYNAVVTSSRIGVSISVPTISALVIIVTTLGGICFFAEAVTVRKIAGIVVLIVGIFLLSPSEPGASPSSDSVNQGGAP